MPHELTPGAAMLLAAVHVLACEVTGSTGGAGACASDEVWQAATEEHAESLQAIRFGSKWEAVIDVSERRPARLRPDIWAGHFSFEGASRYGSRTKLTFTIPAAPAAPTCADALQWRQEVGAGGDPVAWARLAILMRTIEVTSPWTSSALGEHWHSAGGSFWYHPTVIAPPCAIPNPCGNHYNRQDACPKAPRSHYVDTEVGIDWVPGEHPARLILSTVSDPVPEQSPTAAIHTQRTEVTTTGPFSEEDVCSIWEATCKGEELSEVPCPSGFQEFGALSVPLAPGIYEAHRTETRVDVVTLTCVSGCDCVTDGDCDDENVCTKDTCASGTCRNLPDDSAIPEQVADDCRRCSAGLVRSVRETAMEDCDTLREETVLTCSSTGPEWLVHWTEEMSGPSNDAHFCQAGEVSGDSESEICNGSGQCPAGSATTSLGGSVDLSCKGFGGQELTFACDVFCATCLAPTGAAP